MPSNGNAAQWDTSRWGRRLDLTVLSLVVALGAAVLVGFAWTRPTTVASATSYQQSGQLAYSAPASPSSVYGAAGLSTGQPVYIRIVTSIQVTYAYRFTTPGTTRLTGTEQLVASISNGQGITRTVSLQPPTPFHGDRFSATGTLQIKALEAIAADFNNAAGQASTASYVIVLSPHVQVRGHLGSLPLKTSFDPLAKFSLSATALVPVSSSSSSPGTGPLSPTAQFSSTSTGYLNHPAGRPNRLLQLPVLDVRIGSLVLFAAAAAAVVLLGRPILDDVMSSDERVRITTRHGSSLVAVQALPEPPALVVVQLSSFTGLSQVARRLECPILHLQSEGRDTYAVVDNGTLYRYSIGTSHPALWSRMTPRGTGATRQASTDRNAAASPMRIS